MIIEDALLPSAAHLTGPSAPDVIGAAIAAAGGELVACRPSNVQYRPKSDLVVRYRCEVRRDSITTSDTVLAATTVNGPHPGTVPVEADTADGTTLSVGVWRWPFDPVLSDLAAMVTPDLAEPHLARLVGGRPHLEVVAYRPTERAVIRVTGPDREIYVKVVPSSAVDGLVRRHERLAAGGLPVPRVLATGTGWVAMGALVGTTLRDRLKSGVAPLPTPHRYRELLAALAEVDLVGSRGVRSRLDDARHHAAMLQTVLPDQRGRIDELVARLRAAPSRPFAVGTVHGDLHEAQLVVDDERVTGLLDIDDVGPGDPLDDVGTLVGHLRFRAATAAAGGDRIDDYALHTRDVAGAGHDPADVDRRIAAVLVGLATGPFRIQQTDWAVTTARVLDLVAHHLTTAEHGRGAR